MTKGKGQQRSSLWLIGVLVMFGWMIGEAQGEDNSTSTFAGIETSALFSTQTTRKPSTTIAAEPFGTQSSAASYDNITNNTDQGNGEGGNTDGGNTDGGNTDGGDTGYFPPPPYGYGGTSDYGGYGGYGYGFGGIVAAPVCNQTLSNKDLFPTTFVAFQANKGDSYSIGEVLFVLAKFPDTSCNVPDPGLMKGCAPRLEVNIAEHYNGVDAAAILLSVSPSTAQVQHDYSVDFAEQPELYTSDGTYSPPWVFILQVTAGMRTASLDVNSLYIPPNCSSVNATFNSTKVNFQGTTLLPQGISIDTTPPQIVAIYTTEKAGRYTVGHFINIIIKFSKDVQISELPDKYSDVFLNAQASHVQLFGVPYIEVNSGAFVALRGYDNPNDRSKLSFLYEVGSGEETPTGKQLDIADNTTIQLNGGSITGDFNGLDADLNTVPPYGVVGSMSDKTRPKIYIYKTGEKFPPLKYDSGSTPDTSVVANVRRNGQISYTRRVLQPTLVTVDLQLNAIFNVVEKSQQLQADFTLISRWRDARLANPSGPAVTLYPSTSVDNGTIWSPRLTFQNRRDLTNYIEGVVRVYNTGDVMFVQRFIASYAVSLNMRDFPFDSQTFQWNVRSTTYPNTVVKFVPATAAASANSSALLGNIVDPTFTYSNYSQTAYTLTTGIFTGYHMLVVSIQAARIATMSSVFLIFPICLVCTALCFVLHQEPAKDARLAVPLSAITATMAFSFVVSNVSPPVSYTTRIHLLIFQTYILAIAELFINYYLWCIEFGRKELARLNGDNKALLNDAHWMPRKIKPPPTNVVVQPEGVYAPKPQSDAVTPAPAPSPASGAEVAIPVKESSAPAEPEKSADTGAYPDKEGKYKDVKDLLETDEVKTFKKLKWGGGPVRMLWGFAVITNVNAAAWAKHVERMDSWMKNLYPLVCAVSIGCIIGVHNLYGLGMAPVPYIGIPDP